MLRFFDRGLASNACMVSNTPETASSSAAMRAKYKTRSSLFKVFKASRADDLPELADAVYYEIAI